MHAEAEWDNLPLMSMINFEVNDFLVIMGGGGITIKIILDAPSPKSPSSLQHVLS